MPNVRISFFQHQSGLRNYATGKTCLVKNPLHDYLYQGQVVELNDDMIDYHQGLFDRGILEITREAPTRPLFYESREEALSSRPGREGTMKGFDKQREEQEKLIAALGKDAHRMREAQITMTASTDGAMAVQQMTHSSDLDKGTQPAQAKQKRAPRGGPKGRPAPAAK